MGAGVAIWMLLMGTELYFDMCSRFLRTSALGWLRHAAAYAVTAWLLSLFGEWGVLIAALWSIGIGYHTAAFPGHFEAWRIREARRRPWGYRVRWTK